MEDDYQPQDLFVLQATDMQLNCLICCRSVTLLDKMGKLMTVFRVLFVAPPLDRHRRTGQRSVVIV